MDCGQSIFQRQLTSQTESIRKISAEKAQSTALLGPLTAFYREFEGTQKKSAKVDEGGEG